MKLYVLNIMGRVRACACACACVCTLSLMRCVLLRRIYTFICGISKNTVLISHFTNGRFSKKKIIEPKIVLIFFTTFVWNFSHSKNTSTIYHKFLIKLTSSRKIFEKSLGIKFHENSSCGNRVLPREQTNMTKLIVAFLNFANMLLTFDVRSTAYFNHNRAGRGEQDGTEEEIIFCYNSSIT